MILKLIAGRLHDLNERNEELAAENIILRDGSRVKEYQERIAHLEFQLDLLKRHFSSDGVESFSSQLQERTASLLIFNQKGRILRLAIKKQAINAGSSLGLLKGDFAINGEPPGMQTVSDTDEVLLLFSSGRVTNFRVDQIPASLPGNDLDIGQAAIPDSPHAGEALVSLIPLSRLPVSNYFLQVSRRGSVKKTMSTIFEKVLSTHYLGRGAVQKNDQAFLVMLAEKKARLALATNEGHILYLDADDLSFSAEERIRMELTDQIVAAFVPEEKDWVICVTQNGKIIHRESSNFENARSPASRGQALIPPSRLEQGTRFIGALPCKAPDWLVTLDEQGNLKTWSVKEACGTGSLRVENQFISIGLIPSLILSGEKV